MTVIAMTREIGSRGTEVAAGVAARLGLSDQAHDDHPLPSRESRRHPADWCARLNRALASSSSSKPTARLGRPIPSFHCDSEHRCLRGFCAITTSAHQGGVSSNQEGDLS
jgi:hypothetical protein